MKVISGISKKRLRQKLQKAGFEMVEKKTETLIYYYSSKGQTADQIRKILDKYVKENVKFT